MRAALTVLAILASATASAACDVKAARIEEAIAASRELQESANSQTVRGVRTLRDAAIVLDTYGHAGECAADRDRQGTRRRSPEDDRAER